jgi:putative phosphoesterase
MRIFVISDSHGDYDTLYGIFKNAKNPDMIIFLGDGLKEISEISLIFDIPLAAVKGNNDFGYNEPYERVEEICGRKIFITHGHGYNIYKNKDNLIKKAKEYNCGAVLFGHTHIQYYGEQDGIKLFNPGAIKYARNTSARGYGILTFNEGEMSFEHIKLKNNMISKLMRFNEL